MKKSKSSEFLMEIFTLLIIVIAVQTVYATVIRPKAEAIRSADLRPDGRRIRTTCRS